MIPIGKGDDRGRWFFLVMAAFAILGKFIPEWTGMARDKGQTFMLIALVPISIMTVWLLRGEKPGAPVEPEPQSEPEAPSSDDN